jgi:hypothetical protein
VPNQRSLSKVVSCRVFFHNGWRFSFFQTLCGDTFTLYDHVEATSILITFLNDIFSSFKPLFFESIGQLGPLILLHHLEDAYFFQKVIILFSFDLNCPFNDMVEGVSVQRPKLAVGGLANDGGCSWGVVEKSKLSE